MKVRPENPDDPEAVREVNRLAFGRADEARLVDALRDGGYARLSLVAEEGGLVVSHILFSDLPIDTSDARCTPWPWHRWPSSPPGNGRGSARCWCGRACGSVRNRATRSWSSWATRTSTPDSAS